MTDDRKFYLVRDDIGVAKESSYELWSSPPRRVERCTGTSEWVDSRGGIRGWCGWFQPRIWHKLSKIRLKPGGGPVRIAINMRLVEEAK